MSYATIYDLDGNTISDGLQSDRVCVEAIQAARQIAHEHRRSVVVEDGGTRDCYLVTPRGNKRPAPKGWVAEWDREE